jgi:hypothetical protein
MYPSRCKALGFILSTERERERDKETERRIENWKFSPEGSTYM